MALVFGTLRYLSLVMGADPTSSSDPIAKDGKLRSAQSRAPSMEKTLPQKMRLDVV